MAHVVVIDEDPRLLAEQVQRLFPADVVTVATAAGAGLSALREVSADVVLLGVAARDRRAIDLYEEIRRLDPLVPVIFATVGNDAEIAIEAMRRGAFDYVRQPADPEQLRTILGEAIAVRGQSRAFGPVGESAPDGGGGDALFGTCPAMLEVYKAIGLVADRDVTVLVTGESGTGKEVVARAIHRHSRRAKAAFTALNCAAIPETLLESELFGHEKGAFTGADRRRIGKFERHSGGTILLDEIGDIAPALQPKILRLLQEQTFERVGGNETIRTDVRLVAATHRDLRALVAEDKFRLDLFYRLGVFTIHLAPLRERGSDIPLLVQHYVQQFSRELGRDVRSVAPDVMERLCAYAWPGNIRELQNVLKQAVLRAQGSTLLSAFLPVLGHTSGAPVAAVVEPARRPPAPSLSEFETFLRGRVAAPDVKDLYADAREYVDRFLFTLVLERTRGNYSAAAQLLGISRQTLRRRLPTLGISVARSVALD
ncbi:MAG TPA: sigma-54 dependent transcriptional regulator [Polyangia bacterium]|nr:sigma-54 dependent transcriptional regulator [Polyangia bacterium]